MNECAGADGAFFQKLQKHAVAFINAADNVVLARFGGREQDQPAAGTRRGALGGHEVAVRAASAASDPGDQFGFEVGGDGMFEALGFVVNLPPFHAEDLVEHALDEVMADHGTARDFTAFGGELHATVLYADEAVALEPAERHGDGGRRHGEPVRERGGDDLLAFALGFEHGLEVVLLGDGDHGTGIIAKMLSRVNEDARLMRRHIESGGMAISFEIKAQQGAARRGRLITAHGAVETPVFMPVGTLANVKGISQDILEELGVEILLSNTYHLFLRPGVEMMKRLGGLHRFMSWERAILTDSGGFQVWSLSKLRKINEEGVQFRSHLDGSLHMLGPETATAAQIALGADVIMAFDECTEHPAERGRARESMELTLRWAERCKRYFEEHKHEAPWADAHGERRQGLFGIVQGGMHLDLRRESAERTVEIGFPGYAIGGLSVGEPRNLTREVVEATLEHLPEDKPRYLMGVGTPEEIVQYAGMGVDMMDCVLPTRAARHGLLFTSEGKITIRNAAFAADEGPVDAKCGCPVCARYSRAYLRHLYACNELLAQVLNTVHNLAYYLNTMRDVREGLLRGSGGGEGITNVPPAAAKGT